MSNSITACSQFAARVANIFVMLLRCGGEGSCGHYLLAVPGRCFGLPLYSAIAREALAARLGLLPFSASTMFAYGTKRTCAGALHMSAFGGKADISNTVALTFEGLSFLS